MPCSRSRRKRAVRERRRLQADRARRRPPCRARPRAAIPERRRAPGTLPSGSPQSPLMSMRRHRAAIAARLVELDQPVMQRRAGEDLQLRIERRADRKAALVELFAAVELDQVAAHFFGEEFRGEEIIAARAHGDLERARLRRLAVGRRGCSRSRPCGRSPSSAARSRAPGGEADCSFPAPSAAPRDRPPRRS